MPISKWVSETSKRNFSHPLHPRLKITASTRIPRTEKVENVSQAQTPSMSSINDIRQDSSILSPSLPLPLHKLDSPPKEIPHNFEYLKQKLQSFNALNWVTDVARSYLVLTPHFCFWPHGNLRWSIGAQPDVANCHAGCILDPMLYFEFFTHAAATQCLPGNLEDNWGIEVKKQEPGPYIECLELQPTTEAF
jgi:hypothetical protein